MGISLGKVKVGLRSSPSLRKGKMYCCMSYSESPFRAEFGNNLSAKIIT